jgi:hypothetical protein
MTSALTRRAIDASDAPIGLLRPLGTPLSCGNER